MRSLKKTRPQRMKHLFSQKRNRSAKQQTRRSYSVVNLPTIQNTNHCQYPEWSAYIQKIYHENIPTNKKVPLQSFTWFYNNAPFSKYLHKRTQNIMIALEEQSYFRKDVWLGDIALTYNKIDSANKFRLTENDIYVGGFKTILSSALLRRATNYGFFVKRKSFDISYIKHQLFHIKRIEVLHVLENQELPVTWFWLVRGSGVFLDVSFANQIKVYASRAECELYKKAKTQQEIDYIDMHKLQVYMKHKRIDIVVFFQAHGVPEMIIRHTRVQNTQAMSMPQDFFYTGFDGRRFLRSNTNLHFPLTHITPCKQPPVWFSETEYDFYQCMMQEETRYNMQVLCHNCGKHHFRQLLHKWYPVWYYHRNLKKQLDFLATPLLFAYVKQDAKLINFLCAHESIEKQLRIEHPHNKRMNVRDLLFSYYLLHPTKMSIRPPPQKIIYVRAPCVSQHFWHFMMGEFLPIVSEILKHTPQKIYIIKEHYLTCPFNAFYRELPFQIHILKNDKNISKDVKVQSPLPWNNFNHGEPLKLVAHLTVEFLKEWVATTATKKKSTRATNYIIVQNRVNVQKLDDWYATDYRRARRCKTTDELVQYQYGAKTRHITNLKDIYKQLLKDKKNVEFRQDDLLPLKTQISGYLHASTLILGHGSGMVHMLWMKPRSTIIEIIPKHRIVKSNGYLNGCQCLCDLMNFTLKRVPVHDDISAVNPSRVLSRVPI